MSEQLSLASHNFIRSYLELLQAKLVTPLNTSRPLGTALPMRVQGKKCALTFMPHPDDECLTAALPIRLKREQGWQIINIAVTLGSNLARRPGRASELAHACAVLGFECVLPQEDGFSELTLEAREKERTSWGLKVARVAEIIDQYRPEAVFFPHGNDWNGTHLATHALVMEALEKQKDDFTCAVFQTEYWQPISEPNRLIGVSSQDAAVMLAALTCHVGEVARNPYDKSFPAFLTENVRRGSERVAGKGATAASMDFAMMYTQGTLRHGRVIPSLLKSIVAPDESVAELF